MQAVPPLHTLLHNLLHNLFKVHTACICFSIMRLIESVHTQSEAINNLQYAEQACLYITQVRLSAVLIYARRHWTAHMYAARHTVVTLVHIKAASISYFDVENYC